ncbi:MAG: hypothetical protein RBR06_05755 [Desulfuromonadaceae bacterium]|nr:hypothetical protein [Desulfuromonadaceae bacterium]
MLDIVKRISLHLATISITLALVAGSAFADKPDWAGGVKNSDVKEHRVEKELGIRDRNDNQRGVTVTVGFHDNDRRVINEYYSNEKRKGKCPPGLAKKNNGCQPPGQAKKWQKGQPLAKHTKYYKLPKELRVRLPLPPPNHRYVRVAGDILMIATGTSMVVDAIEDIMR